MIEKDVLTHTFHHNNSSPHPSFSFCFIWISSVHVIVMLRRGGGGLQTNSNQTINVRKCKQRNNKYLEFFYTFIVAFVRWEWDANVKRMELRCDVRRDENENEYSNLLFLSELIIWTFRMFIVFAFEIGMNVFWVLFFRSLAAAYLISITASPKPDDDDENWIPFRLGSGSIPQVRQPVLKWMHKALSRIFSFTTPSGDKLWFFMCAMVLKQVMLLVLFSFLGIF